MTKKYSVTIGIPAYNEEKNIGNLLNQLINQNISCGVIESIIVASDGSIDKTAQIVKGIKDKKVFLINGKTRHGKAYRQNQIVKKTRSNVLVLLDADTSIKDSIFLEKLVKPIVAKEADLTSSTLIELPVRGFLERVLAVSMQLKRVLFASFKNGNNIYNCHGPARAFSKKACRLLNFIESDGEDMYSYLVCVRKGLKFLYVSDAQIMYRLPSNLKDHTKQSMRFFLSEKKYEKYFNSGFGKKEFSIPLYVFFIAFAKALPIIIRNLPYIVVYIFIFLYTKAKVSFGKKYGEMWQIASSKSL